MNDPFEFYFKFQKMWLASSMQMAQMMTASMVRLFEHQAQLWGHYGQRRAEDEGKKKPKAPLGPDLQDRYGRRARDVDVEKI